MKIDKDQLQPIETPLVRFAGTSIYPLGMVTLQIIVGTHPKQAIKKVNFLVVDCPSAYNVIIGRPTLNRLRAVTSTYHLLVRFPTENGIGEMKGDQAMARECYLTTVNAEQVHQTLIVEERQNIAEPTEELEEIVLIEGDEKKTTRIGTSMAKEIRASVVSFLRGNADVFAWSHDNMPGISTEVISHKLNVNPSTPPVKQKRRVFAPERNTAVMEEVDKLLKAGFIREVYYPEWLANVVMVKKSTGKWRMCVDFTDLNKACPNDSYPLPRIDQLVDSTAGHKLLSFMDAFFGYNQIQMTEGDQEKTAFITSRGLFCYKVMPFGLKNAGATYQRLVNKMFHDQIGRNVEVYVDDMLVQHEAKEDRMKRYLTVVKNLLTQFKKVELLQIPREENEAADRLARLASSGAEIDGFVEIQGRPSTEEETINPISFTTTWMLPIIRYLKEGTLPADRAEAHKLRIRASRFQLLGGILYKMGFSRPYLRCLSPEEVNYVIREVHEGVCGNHSGVRSLAHKLTRVGYYWPSFLHDATQFVKACDKCQCFASVPRVPPEEFTPITSPWPFAQWGLDIMGPFPVGTKQAKFLVVAIDYFTKWVEAEPLSTISENNVKSFVWKAVICRFGIPRVLISDNGKQFDNGPFRELCAQLNIKNHYSSPRHPQANGQVEVTNRTLLKQIKTRLEGAKSMWVEELPSVL
uniref:Integrase catalytic domain-containing protein n=1 Tax=Fagus sylvatica TaxID=28930 RepID=A0A2N9F8I3_FAGSY